MDIAVFAMRSIVALVFISAGTAKLAQLASFDDTLRSLFTPRLPAWITYSAATIVPVLELGLGLGLLSGVAIRVIDVAVCLVAAGFVAIGYVGLRRAPNTRCRCFGTLTDSRFNRRAIARAALVLAATSLVAIGDGTGWAYYRPFGWSTVVLLVLGVAFGVAAAQAATALARTNETAET